MSDNENLRTVESLASYVSPDDVDIKDRKAFLSTVASRICDDVRSNDIMIHWGNRASYNRHKVALQVQDAGNLLALSREFVKVVQTAFEENRSTEKTWEDPAVRLFVNKFESLCRSDANFSEAYRACQEKAAGKEGA